MSVLSQTAVVGLTAWLIASSLWVYPHSLSYFNESIGGPMNGPKHLLGSNIDWGQDLLYVNSWRLKNSPTQEVGLAYHGGFAPEAAKISGFVTLSRVSAISESRHGDQVASHIHDVISINLLMGYKWFAYDGQRIRTSYRNRLAASYGKYAESTAICYSMKHYAF